MYYRPYLTELLTKCAAEFDVHIFSSSDKEYCDLILKQIDPEQKYFKERWYKKSCLKADNGQYIKDLTVLGLALDRVVLVDNCSFSFAHQLLNGIPIVSYTGNQADMELMGLLDYLMNLSKVPEVRKANLEYFKLPTYFEQGDVNEVFNKIFGPN